MTCMPILFLSLFTHGAFSDKIQSFDPSNFTLKKSQSFIPECGKKKEERVGISWADYFICFDSAHKQRLKGYVLYFMSVNRTALF